MKQILFLGLFGLYSVSTFSQSEWKWITPNPPYKGVYSSVLVGNTAYFWCADNTVMRMYMPTETMEVISVYAPVENVGIGDFANQGIAFANSVFGYITDISAGEFRTTNGGLNWFKTANPGSNIFLVVFGSSEVGWKLGGGGFYRTSDAGETWTYLGGPFFQTGAFSKMFALNENQLWILTRAYYSGSEGSIWYSTNSGYNWSKINTGLTSDSINQVTYYDIKVDPSGVAFAIGSVYNAVNNITEGFIQKTTDMGVTWSLTKFQDERYKNILSINENEWVILGNEGYYQESQIIQRKTTDMGRTWSLTYPVIDQSYYKYFYNAMYTPSTDKIYLITTLGIYKSTDRGNSYNKMTSETDIPASEVVFDSKPINSDNQIGIAWLKWNIKPYLITFDAGQTWHQKTLPQSMGYIWLVGIAEEVIYIIVNQNQLYKSVDLGQNWIQLNVPVYSGLQALDVFSKDVFVLNAHKNLVSSTDGGNTWSKGPIVENLWLEETDIISPGNIVGVGSYYDTSGTRGSFFKTSDYGFSWHITDTDKQLHQVQMLNDRIGFALGDNKIYKTSDAGDSWNIILSKNSYFQVYSSFSFSDSLNGLVSEGYYFRKTTNGGSAWSTENLWIPLGGIDRMVFNAKGDLFVIGGGVMLMLPSNSGGLLQGKDKVNDLTSNYYLHQNYPNPFNPSTTISWQVPVGSWQTLKIYDVLGNEIATLVDEYRPAGKYEVEFNPASSIRYPASGVFFYQLKSGEFIQTKKMVLLK